MDQEPKDKAEETALLPVFETARGRATLTHPGVSVAEHTETDAKGLQKAYVVLTEDERAKGFVRPVRETYVHLKCGVVTRMGSQLAETYARDPKFYTGTYCVHCKAHFPVGEDGEFVWNGTEEKVGT